MRIASVALLAGLVASIAAPASADEYKGFQAGDMLVRGRGLLVLPTVSSDVSVIGGEADADISFEPEGDFTYFFTPHIAVEAIAGVTRHSVRVKDSAIGDVDLGDTTLLPPTVSLQYHFMPESDLKPYLGAGINYTFFFDTDPAANSAATKVHYENGFGASIQAGVDYRLQGNWFVNFDVKHIFLNTEVKVNGGAIKADVDLDPTIVGFGLGYKF